MNKIKAKLNSKRGVSIVMALLLALICLFAGAAALTAASANIGRYSYLREDNQDYLSISSAARLLSEQFEQGSNNISADYSSGKTIATLNSPLDNNHVYNLLKDKMTDLLWYCYNMNLPPEERDTLANLPSETKFTVTVEGDNSFKPVYVNVTATASASESLNAEILVELYTLEPEKPDELKYHERNLKFTVKLTFDVTPDDGKIVISKAEVERITLPGKLEETS